MVQATEHFDKELRKDLETLARFINIYCTHRHASADKTETTLKTHDVEAIAGGPITLCSGCQKLLAHAFVKRTVCPMHPKPACKHCPSHCYHPKYRQQIQEVMQYSGRRLIFSGRLDYLYHLLF